MKILKSTLSVLLLLVFIGCDKAPTEDVVVPVEGREAEAVLYISNSPWFPATIGILRGTNDDDIEWMFLEISSSTNLGYSREVRFNIIDDRINWPPGDTLDLSTNEFPTRVSLSLKQYRDERNRNFHLWQGGRPDMGGVKIYKIEEEEGITYASGEFDMIVGNDDLNPRAHIITALFNNVRVFTDQEEMDAYFAEVNAWLRYTGG
ncbi:MAG: hypothetical protein HEP71_23745 [Roseivirga sp.]|nr:hypothetical protein [Roseivirga sp.]